MINSKAMNIHIFFQSFMRAQENFKSHDFNFPQHSECALLINYIANLRANGDFARFTRFNDAKIFFNASHFTYAYKKEKLQIMQVDSVLLSWRKIDGKCYRSKGAKRKLNCRRQR